MCGRYQFTAEQCAELQEIVQEVRRRCGKDTWTPGEIRPLLKAPVLVEREGMIEADLMRWGFQTQQSLMINARSESAEEKPLFRDSVQTRRCVVPASGFYEWSADKRKYLFRLPDAQPLYMAGIYDQWQDERCYCILTTEANESARGIHSRMPVVLRREEIRGWLIEPSTFRKMLKKIPPQLLATAEDNQTSLW
ncbi:SOS response-associated peptidase [uncultured Oscillibacter sp.]|uniref:SOS response-associated peptidase n=1 Tax=uncultured Oscillibacter sp. TaxID=876091 RepID=UPI0025D88F9F|nr:SOS response-associated peptidase [uncultured Oscillibacter sp.]